MTKNPSLRFILWVAFGIILLIAAVLRLHSIEEYVTFLVDQGRDAIAMKRIITGENFPGIGPRSSIGQLFLGPFYYYLMAPFLFFAGYNPIGPAIGVALITLVGMGLAAWKIRRDIGWFTALLFLCLVTVSYSQIWLSRFSWNPNLLPAVSFAGIYLAYYTAVSRRLIYPIIFGFILSASLQLHYLMLSVLPAIGGIILWGAYRYRKSKADLIRYARNLSLTACVFVVAFAPLIVFDFRNNFLNLRGFVGIFAEKQFQTKSSYPERLLEVLNGYVSHLLMIDSAGSSGWIVLILLLAASIIGLFWWNRVSRIVTIHSLSVLSFTLVFALIDTNRYIHYYTPVYWSIFFIVAYWVSRIAWKPAALGTAVILVSLYTVLNAQHYDQTKGKGNFQTRIAESIADHILSLNVEQPYFLLSIPVSHTNDHIRYYLELKGAAPLPPESTDDAKAIVFLCYEKEGSACDVTEDNQYQAVIFGDKKIAKEVVHPEVRIFKVVHAR